MRRAVASLCAVVFAGCADSSPELEHANLGGIGYSVPAGWTSTEQSEHQTKIVVWRPTNNAHKESLVLMRTRETPALAKSDFSRIQQFLGDATKTLPGKFGTPTRFRTKHGLAGARVDGELLSEAGSPYRRMHAVVLDGNSLVHVLYTARSAQPEMFNLVLDSLIRKDS